MVYDEQTSQEHEYEVFERLEESHEVLVRAQYAPPPRRTNVTTIRLEPVRRNI